MTRKKARTIRGKEIRRATGIKLPVAMNLAKRERKGVPEESDLKNTIGMWKIPMCSCVPAWNM